jgi:DNA-directed RNA polymerase beta' subunit
MNPELNHPKDMIIRNIFVPPSCVRPTVKEDEKTIRTDELTGKLKDFIIRINEIKSKALISGLPYDRIEESIYFL